MLNRREFVKTLSATVLLSGAAQKQDAGGVPDFTLTDIEGKSFRLSDYQEQVILLDFWATWCEPCIDQIPELHALRAKYADRGLAVLSVALESGSSKNIRNVAAKHNIRYPVLIGTDKVQNDFRVVGFPTTLLIGRPWRVHKRYVGLKSTKDTIDRDIQTLLSL